MNCPSCKERMTLAGQYWICGRHNPPVFLPAVETPPIALRDVELSSLPYPIALTAARLRSAIDSTEDVLKTLFKLKDCFEATIKFLGIVLLTDYFRCEACTSDRNHTLLEKMIRPSLGHWVNHVVGDVSMWVADTNFSAGTPVASMFAAAPAQQATKPKATAVLQRCEKFVSYRNDALGHGGIRADRVYAQDLLEWLPLMNELLASVAGMSEWRLCLATERDRCQDWMGADPSASTEPGIFRAGHLGHFLLRGPADAESPVRDLHPFICYLPDSKHESRLHFYDSIYRYQASRKEVQLLEYDEGFKQASPDPIAGLEETFTTELLSIAFKRHQGRMEIIEGRVANFGELLETHADIVGRRFAIEHVERFVEEQDRGLLVIEAEPGKGKTALLCYLIENEFGHYSPPPVHFFYRRTAGITNPDVCVRSLYGSLLEAHNITEATDSQGDSPEVVYTKLVNLLNEQIGPKLTPSRPQLIFIDGLDEAEATTGPNAFERIPENLPAGVYVIASTRPVRDRVSLARRTNLQWYDLDAPDLVQANLRDGADYVQRELAATELPAETLEEISRLGGGNFLVLKLLCQRLSSMVLPAAEVRELLTWLATEPQDDRLGFIYEEFWNRIVQRLNREDASLLCDVAGLLVTACAPLSAEMVCECLKIRAGDWDFALRHLVEYLTSIVHDESGEQEIYYHIYHESFADFLRAKVAVDRRRLETLLTDYCLRWAELRPGRGRLYALKFVCQHLIDLERWDDLESLLTDIFFLDAKNESGLAFELVGDFSGACANLPKARILGLLEEALRRDIHFIDRHRDDYPQALFQCLWNSCWWYDHPDSARHYHKAKPPSDDRLRPLSQLLEEWKDQKGRAMPGFRWIRSYCPPRLCIGSAQLARLEGHESGVSCVAFSPDGQRIASGSEDHTVRVWDIASGGELACLGGHTFSVDCVAFSPSGQRIASGSGKTALVWDIASGGELARLEYQEKEGLVEDVAFSSDAQPIATTKWNRNKETVQVWDIASGRQLACLEGHEDEVKSAAISRDGQRIVSSSEDHTVRVWDAASGRQLAKVGGYDLREVAISTDGQRIACESGRDSVRVWDAASGRELAHIKTGFCARSCAFSPDAQRIACGPEGHAHAVWVWDIANARELDRMEGHEEMIWSLAFSPDGQRIASGSKDKTVRVWDAASNRELANLEGHKDLVEGVAFSPDGRRIASWSRDNTVRVWHANSGVQHACLEGHEGEVRRVAFSPDGQRIASGSEDRTVRVWDAASGRAWGYLKGHKDTVWDVAFSPDGQRIASGSEDHTVRVWDAVSGRELACLEGHKDWVWALAFSPDSQQIASGSADHTVRVWDIASGRELACLEGHEHPVSSVAFSPSCQRIASGSWDNTARVWDIASGGEKACLEGHKGWVEGVAFSPDGRRIASWSRDNTVRVWHANSGECLEVIEGNGDVAAIASGAETYPLRALTRHLETIIQDAGNGKTLATMPGRISHITTHPKGHTWAGAAGNHVYVFTLEGK